MYTSLDMQEVELEREAEIKPEKQEPRAVPLSCDGRRHDARCFLKEPIRFSSVEQSPNFFGVLTNLSETGVYIETSHTLPLLTLVLVDYKGGRMWGEVCRVDWIEPQNRGQRSCGFALRSCENMVACEQFTHEADWHEGSTVH